MFQQYTERPERALVEGTHLLEGDGCLPNFFHYVWKKRHNSVHAQHDLKVPSTVVYSDGFPKEWHVVTKQGDLEMRIGKEIVLKDILKDMCTHGGKMVTEDGMVVAWYMFKVLQEDGTYRPAVEYFDRRGLDLFLHGKVVRRDGFLQKFIFPESKRNVVLQAIWSPNPATQVIGKRENNLCFYDRRHTMAERVTTYEGPIHHSREAFVAPHIQWQLKQLCKEFVDHFLNTEHAAIQRMVLYFKVDGDSDVWVLWCSSVRIHAYGPKNPLDLCIEYMSGDCIEESHYPHTLSLMEGAEPEYGTEDEYDRTVNVTQRKADRGVAYNPKPPSLGPTTAYAQLKQFGFSEKTKARRLVLEQVRNGTYKPPHKRSYAEGVAPVLPPIQMEQTAAGAPGEPAALVPGQGGTPSGTRAATPKSGAPVPHPPSASTANNPGSLGNNAMMNALGEFSPYMGYRNVRRHSMLGGSKSTGLVRLKTTEPVDGDGDEWEVLLAPQAKPSARYYWDLVSIALHSKYLGEMAKEYEFQQWINLYGTIATAKQQQQNAAFSIVSMTSGLFNVVGASLISYLATVQVTVRRISNSVNPNVDICANYIGGDKHGSYVTLQIGKQQSTSVLWTKMREFAKQFFTARIAALKVTYEKYKQRALKRELVRLGRWVEAMPANDTAPHRHGTRMLAA
eukprot:TRINITY_DN28080_c0_g1_i1.p1 TRINITY_DN28080_c0_g1~~TRINITY_DN28080_c0_g1_i1.p1  ORF type:complete len:701 (+),score=268.18 TRINITY_DN28080_c0_g1_i1:80-2104(+)